jgi:tetratricopeptide (TPR) repeat protein
VTSRGRTTSSGERLDRLAELEDERRFLLRSLADLEREHEAGDVDDADYRTLKDGYTVRAASVLRQIEEGQAQLPQRPQRRWGRVVASIAVVTVLSVGIGLALANAWGERSAGQEITGFTPGDNARLLLANARDAMSAGDFELANSLYARVLESERDRGRDSVEAVTYFGWTLALATRRDPDQALAGERLDAARLALSQAIQLEPGYADPHCFMSIIEYQFRGDADAALPYVEQCELLAPPADVAGLVASFADEIRAAAGQR